MLRCYGLSLRALFETPGNIDGHSGSDVETIAFLASRGGWPWAVTELAGDASLETAYDYVAAICERDISRADGVARNPQYARVILREYARVSATQAKQTTIRSDIRQRGTELSRDTVDSYIATLRKLYVVQELPAWSPSLRARSRVTRTPRRHLCDPSVAVAALGAGPESLLRDLPTLGPLFETLCVRDLRVYAQALRGEVLHYRDESGLEADAVVSLRDGRYGLFEMKLGAWEIDEGTRSLLKLSQKINSDIMGPPSFCAVVVPGGYAYRRDDGVFVVPITCLGQ